MAKKLFYKALSVLILIAALTLYILQFILHETFGIFDIKVSLLILAGGWGIVSLIKAIASKVNLYLIIAAVLITGAAILSDIIFDFLPIDAQKNWLYIPIGIGLLLVFLFIRYLFNIRKWDAGDNEKLGYKNFRERQAEKEKADIDEQIEDLKKEIRQKDKEKTLLMMDIEDKEKQKDSIKAKK